MQQHDLILNETLRDARRAGERAPAARGSVLRNRLVVGEVALSLVLLVGAALLIRSFVGMQSVKPGFDHEQSADHARHADGTAYDSTYKRHAFRDRS